jgi:thiol-disulfide isomerase/thioredoxin
LQYLPVRLFTPIVLIGNDDIACFGEIPMRTTLLCLTVLVFGLSTAFAMDRDEFMQQWAAAEGKAAKVSLAQQAVLDANDIDVIRAIQDKWEEYDSDSALNFFQSLVTEDESAQNLYLMGRLQDSPTDQIDYARRALTIDPEFIYGYRLLGVTYQQNLYRGEEGDEHYTSLKGTFDRDLPVFHQATDILSDNAEAWGYYYDALGYQKDYAAQLKVLETGKELGARWARVQGFTNAYVGLGDYQQALDNLSDMLGIVDSPDGSQADLFEEHLYRYAMALESAGAWAEAVRYFKAYDNDDLKPLATVFLAAAYQHLGKEEAMFGALESALALGFDSAMELQDLSEFESYHGTERWDVIVAAVKENRQKNAPKRREEALANRMDISAPEMAMTKVDGSTVTLADLKGQVVVIDFWATWCGPCRMAMPEIDEFTEKYSGKGVTVISLNVWENVPEKAKKFMSDNEYDMHLMWGEGDVNPTDLFEVTGIPTLVVIDKDGVIRFKEVGYEEGLAEKLGWLADDLL